MLERSSEAPVARLDGVVKRRGSTPALDNLSLVLFPGQVTALLGPNGAGKSTAVGVLTGRLAPDAGETRLFGADPRVAGPRTRLGVMLQDAGMPRALTVGEQIDLFRGLLPGPAGAGRRSSRWPGCRAWSAGAARRFPAASNGDSSSL